MNLANPWLESYGCNETQDGQETSTELRAAHDALAAGAERYVLLKTKYNKVKEDKTSLRGALAEKDAQIHSLGQKNSRIQAEYEAEEKEKAQLQQALRELLETAEGLRNEGKENKGEIIDTAMGVPRPQDHASLMKQRYPAGKIKVTATGLQCVGFSMELYESLRHRFAICSKKEEGKAGTPSEELRDANKKRKAGSQDLRDGKVQSQKLKKS
ncbi:hypothetical protein B0H14DRAFT_3892150 [Mycena olivaceomarginata]|nr:hypothetical protein B0H14DRAFT_3892150 [Mycena olivaceomarginata]